MALGTITPQPTSPLGTTVPTVFGGLKVTVTNVGGDSSYPAGGSSLTPQQLGLPNKVIFAVVAQTAPITTPVTTGLVGDATYNTATSKLQIFQTTGAETTAATSLTGSVWQVIAFGY